MFKMKFPTKRIFRIFHILRINGMAPFCNLFMERPSYNYTEDTLYQEHDVSTIVCSGQVKSRVIAHVCSINTNTSVHEHLHDVVPTHHRCPMQQAESMLISTTEQNIKHKLRSMHCCILYTGNYFTTTSAKHDKTNSLTYNHSEI